MTPVRARHEVCVKEKCGNVADAGNVGCGLSWRERGDAGKVEMKRVDLPRAVHLTTTAPPSPSAASTHHFNFQLLTVFTSFSRKNLMMKRMFENSHEHHDIDLGG